MEGQRGRHRRKGKGTKRGGASSKAKPRRRGGLAGECRRYLKSHDDLGFESQSGAVYCLPSRLLDLAKEVDIELFDADALCFERSFAVWCEKHHFAGLFGGRPLPAGPLDLEDVYARADHHLARKRSARLGSVATEESLLGDEPEYEATAEAVVRDRLRGYVGWLVTNPEYLEGRNRLRALAANVGRALAGKFPEPAWAAEGQASSQRHAKGDAFIEAYRRFCARWCLQGLLSWDLPEPMGPQIRHDGSEAAPGPVAGLRIFLPVTLRVPKALLAPQRLAQSRKQILDTPASGPSPSYAHLKKWLDLDVRSRANQRSRFSDLFVIWFYWRVLRKRYAPAIHGHTPDVHYILNSLVEGTAPRYGRGGEKARVRIREARKRLGGLADI